MRLLCGALAPFPVEVTLTGDPQLLARPMARVAAPLRSMGAGSTTADGGRPPVELRGGDLRGIDYTMPVASAQVKSAVLLAGLGADGTTTVREPVPTRDHTERLLAAMGARVTTDGWTRAVGHGRSGLAARGSTSRVPGTSRPPRPWSPQPPSSPARTSPSPAWA